MPAITSTPTARMRNRAAFLATAAILCLLLSLAPAALADDQQSETAVSDIAEKIESSFVAHGQEYGKNETVAVKTDLTGKLDSISVEEWLKNPQGLEVLEDASNLQNIASDDGLSFTQDGENLTWQAKGQDVVYTGTATRELPFALSYEYQLDGAVVDPSQLQNATGKLQVRISYENLTSATVSTGYSSYDIQDPFIMASVISFDPEHARNISVDNGSVVDQQGTLLAVGIAMPGLEQTLRVEDMVDLPTSVTITADVAGFDMPDITTIVTSQALGMLDAQKTGDIQAQLDDALGQLGNITTGTEMLAKGNDALSQAIGKIAEGSQAMAENLPNATDGLAALSQMAQATNTTVSAAQQAQGSLAANEQAASDAQAQARDAAALALETLPQDAGLSDALDSQLAALEALQSIDTSDASSLSDPEKKAIANAIEQLEGSIAQTQSQEGALNGSLAETSAQLTGTTESLDTAIAALQENDSTRETVNEQLAAAAQQTSALETGLTNATAGFQQVQEGMTGLSQALGQISEGSGNLKKAASKLSDGIAEAISTVQSTANEKIDLINAISDYVKAQPAFGGSTPDMPATTLYMVHAKSDPTPLR